MLMNGFTLCIRRIHWMETRLFSFCTSDQTVNIHHEHIKLLKRSSCLFDTDLMFILSLKVNKMRIILKKNKKKHLLDGIVDV